jgi:tryptophanyl-tRNA synthetase
MSITFTAVAANVSVRVQHSKQIPLYPLHPPTLPAVIMASEQVITPFDVSGGTDESGKELAIDYAKLTRDFGATLITSELLARFEAVTGKKPHRFMRRGIVLSHRDLDKILDRYERGQPFYLYTGRGPSSDSMHVGHSIPFDFTKYLQETFDCPLVIQLTDDEKFMHNPDMTIPDVKKYTIKNCEDIIAIGFDPAKTFIFSDFSFMGGAFYENVCMMAKRTTINSIKGTFGFNDSNNIGEFHFPATQSATSFATSFPHIFGTDEKKVAKIPALIPCAIDQDPYFRQCRDNAEKVGYMKPGLIHTGFLPSLLGPGSKMSASKETSAVFLSDTPKKIKEKINKHAFSGGQDTLELQRELGGRTDVDVSYQYLTFFMEDDDELAEVKRKYEAGEMLTGELKALCIKHVQDYVGAFQERKKLVTEEVRKEFMAQKPLVYGGNPNPIEVKEEVKKKEVKVKVTLPERPKENGHQKQKSVSSTEKRKSLIK